MIMTPFAFCNEPNSIPMGVRLICEFHADPNYCIRRKTTDIFCFDFIISGEQHIRDKNITYTARANDFCIIRGNAPQLFYAEKNAQPLKKLSICAYGDFLPQLLDAYDLKNIVYRNVECENIMLDLLSFTEHNQTDYEKICMQTAISLQKIFILIKHAQSSENLTIPENFLQVRKILDAKIYEKFNIDELSYLTHISKPHLIKYFKKYFDCSPYNYFMSKKLELAKVLLQTTSLSIKEIALKLSFIDEHYFSYYFKQKTGISPSHYRKNNS